MENKKDSESSASGSSDNGAAPISKSYKYAGIPKKNSSFTSKIDTYLRAKLASPKREENDVEKLRRALKKRNLLKENDIASTPMQKRMLDTMHMILSNFVRAESARTTKSAANIFFGGFVKISPAYFEPLKEAIAISDMNIIPESYVGIVSAIAFSAAFSAALIVAVASSVFGIGFLWTLLGMLIFPVLFFLIAFTIGYTYPFQRVNAKKQNINTNLPFAINHMAAIASSGVSPEKAFEMMAQFEEYGAVSTESKNLVRQINVFGKDILNSIRFIAMRTPSKEFKELLYGILSIIETGGNMKDYLNEMSQLALFNYKLARKKYIETLSTYADIYTAILIAAPLFLVSILAVMNIIPGSAIAGLSIEDFMRMGVYILIPGLNMGFLLFISYTQPDV